MPKSVLHPRAFALALGLFCSSAIAAAVSTTPPTVEPTAEAAETVAKHPELARDVVWPFSALGAFQPIALQGVDGRSDINFGIRLDEVVTKARLKLRFSYSPAMLPELSHLKLLLNNEVIGTIALPREQAGSEVLREIEVDPRLFTDFNRLEIHLIGHYTMECEDSMHSSLWASISHRSSLELGLKSLNLMNDMALLPAPFFDRRDNRRLELPFVFAGAASPDALHAAAVLASWFGAQASYRSARFPALINELPDRHAVVFVTNANQLAGMPLPPVELPTISVLTHPRDPAVKLLVLQGKDAQQIRSAADGLALGSVVLTGDSATVTSVNYEPRRVAYDAPNWVRTDRPVKLGELVSSPGELQAIGHAPPPVRVNVRVPPDLLTWNRLGVPIDLRYRYTPPVEQDNSLLTININEQFVQSFRLRPSGKTSNEKGRLLVPLLEDGMAQLEDEVIIPAFQVGSNNQLQFQFVTDMHKEGLCKDTAHDQVRAAIDPDSTIDLTPFPHYTAMPNLALFANAGFPFTKYADLAETVVVMPDAAQASDIEAMLFLMGRMGRMTGAPGLRVRLATAAQALKIKQADFLVIGATGGKDLLTQWDKNLPAVIEQGRRVTTPVSPLQAFQRDLLDSRKKNASPWKIDLNAKGPLAAIVGFESPLEDERSVIAITASTAAATASALNALEDDGLVSRMRGDVVFVRDREVDSFEVAERYFVGHLPLWLAIRFHLSGHPILLALLGILAGLLLAFVVHWHLKRVAASRLDP